MKSSQAKSGCFCGRKKNLPLVGTETGDRITEQADNYLQSLFDKKQFSGSVLLARQGEVLLNKGYGCSEYVCNEKNSSQTIYRIGSVTKPFVSLIVLKLIEKKSIKLDQKLSVFCPNFGESKRITVKHLLSNTSGIEDYTDLEEFERKCDQNLSLEDLIGIFSDRPLKFKPGSRYDYSNSNYILLGLIVEKVTGKSFDSVLREFILEPCSMNNTGYESCNDDFLKNDQHLRRAYGHVCTDDGKDFRTCRFIDMSTARTAGGIYSTVEDLYRFDRFLYGKKLICEKTKKTMFKPVRDEYALGWQIEKVNGGKIRQTHTGQIFGFTSCFVRFPREDACIIVLSNLENTLMENVVDDLSDILFQEKRNS